MELLRHWLIGITCAAMIVALADSLTPAGTVKKIGRLVGGLVLLLAVVKPVLGLDFRALAADAANWQAVDAYGEDLDKTNLELMKSIIGERTGAYILDKAEELGACCDAVAVTCEVGEGDMPYPAAVTVHGSLTEAQRRALTRQIEADLAIPENMQTYESGDVEP